MATTLRLVEVHVKRGTDVETVRALCENHGTFLCHLSLWGLGGHVLQSTATMHPKVVAALKADLQGFPGVKVKTKF